MSSISALVELRKIHWKTLVCVEKGVEVTAQVTQIENVPVPATVVATGDGTNHTRLIVDAQ